MSVYGKTADHIKDVSLTQIILLKFCLQNKNFQGASLFLTDSASSKMEYHALFSQFSVQACYTLIINVVQFISGDMRKQPVYAPYRQNYACVARDRKKKSSSGNSPTRNFVALSLSA
jgi:hypothetical protein